MHGAREKVSNDGITLFPGPGGELINLQRAALTQSRESESSPDQAVAWIGSVRFCKLRNRDATQGCHTTFVAQAPGIRSESEQKSHSHFFNHHGTEGKQKRERL